MNSLRDKVVIITGASSGIGMAAAEAFASEGAKVVVAARSLEKLIALEHKLSHLTEVLPVKADVTSEQDCKNLIEHTVARFGKIDILVNNAGLSMRAIFRDLDLNVLKNMMDVKFGGMVSRTT